MELTSFQKVFYNFTSGSYNNIIIKDEKYYPIERASSKIIQSNLNNQQKQIKLFERYIEKL